MAEIFYCSFHTSMMFKEIRFQKIQEIIHNDGEAKVEELAEKFSVSEMTIRHDLNTMVQKGLIERTHGGAVLAKDRNLLQSPILMRLYEQVEEKRAIARAVVKMLKRNEKIYISAGTTTYWIAKSIALEAGAGSVKVISKLLSPDNVPIVD